MNMGSGMAHMSPLATRMDLESEVNYMSSAFEGSVELSIPYRAPEINLPLNCSPGRH